MWKLQQSIPKRFLKGTRAASYDFRVSYPARLLATRGEAPGQTKEACQQLAGCRFRSRDGDVAVRVSMKRDPRIWRAIVALGSLAPNGHRPTKYLTIYQAYEELAPFPREDLAALRHALAHSPAVLSRRRTVQRLESLFGTTNIDLEDMKHQQVFWSLFGELLIEVDEMISAVLQGWMDAHRHGRDT
jgi:hypothetical protein